MSEGQPTPGLSEEYIEFRKRTDPPPYGRGLPEEPPPVGQPALTPKQRGESREATHAWIKEHVGDHAYAHGLADDVFDLEEQLAREREARQQERDDLNWQATRDLAYAEAETVKAEGRVVSEADPAMTKEPPHGIGAYEYKNPLVEQVASECDLYGHDYLVQEETLVPRPRGHVPDRVVCGRCGVSWKVER